MVAWAAIVMIILPLILMLVFGGIVMANIKWIVIAIVGFALLKSLLGRK